MNEELKPCPFCGGAVSIATMGGREFKWFSITRGNDDTKCTCRLFMESEPFPIETNDESKKAELIRRWNQRVGGEYNHGWIPVTERMPEEHEDSTTNTVHSDFVLVTVYDVKSEKYFVDEDCTVDGKWYYFGGSIRTIAWQPFPEAYQKGLAKLTGAKELNKD